MSATLATHAAPTPTPDRALLARADATTPALRLLWLALFRRLRRAIPRAALRAALARGDRFTPLALLATAQATTLGTMARLRLRALLAPLMTQAAEAMLPALRAALRSAPGVRPPLPVVAPFSPFIYQPALPEAVQTLEAYIAAEVARILATTSEALRDALLLLPDWLVADVAGMTPRQVASVAHVHAGWAVEGLSHAVQRARVQALALRALTLRAETNAITQSMTAANLGQQQLWEQAERAGFLLPDEWERVWLTAFDERRCPRCKAMSGQRRGLHEPFLEPGGVSLLVPPLHSRCRCVVTLVRPLGVG